MPQKISDKLEHILDLYNEKTWFDRYFKKYNCNGPGIDRWANYFYPYERHFERFRNKSFSMLEIGVQSGGSTFMWRDYFGKDLNYYGMEKDPQCLQFARDHVTIFVGDQDKEEDLRNVISKMPRPSIIIDDGGHQVKQLILTFLTFFPFLEDGGVYLIEDIHTNYLKPYGGGVELRNLNPNASIIELTKYLIWILRVSFYNNHLGRNPA